MILLVLASITEHLTPFTRNVLSLTQAIVGKENVSVVETIVRALFNRKEYKIANNADFNKLNNLVEVSPLPPSTQPEEPVSNVVNNSSEPRTFPNNLPLGGHSNSHIHRLSSQASLGLVRPRGRPSQYGRGGSRSFNIVNPPRNFNSFNPNWGYY